MSHGILVCLIRDLPRWLFLAALIYAPWDYGGTTPRSIIGIDILLAGVVGGWLVELAVRRRRPDIYGLVVIIALVIVVLGWFVTLNARAVYDVEVGEFAPLRNWLSFAPSSVDAPISAATMMRLTVLVGVILFAADLSLRPHWLGRIWITIGLAGGSIALLGLLQRATGAVLPFWEYRPWQDHFTFFATYYYHANAGAFFNLVLAPTAGLAVRAFSKRNQPLQRAVWVTALLLIVMATLVNTSRVAQLLSLLTIVALAVGPARRMWRDRATSDRAAVGLTVVMIFAVLFAIGQASGSTRAIERWQIAIQQIPKDDRWEAYRMAWEAVPDAGWTGFGPGTFQLIFPEYERLHAVEEPGQWQFLHQDYLQTILEWGWGGAVCWALIFFGGIGVAIRAFGHLRHQIPGSRISRVLPLVLIALGTVMLHSVVDFPLQIASLQLYAATYLGICWSCQGASRRLAQK